MRFSPSLTVPASGLGSIFSRVHDGRRRAKSVQSILFVLLLFTCISLAQAASPASVADSRILFVGNSLTYVADTPAVFTALARDNGRPVSADMIAFGGATLSQRVADNSVAQALGNGKYAVLVLQERGGDLVGAFGPDADEQSRQAVKQLARLGSEHGAKVVLMGTYQIRPHASQALVEMEAAAAAEAGIDYIEVSEKLRRLRTVVPQLTWMDADGMHPGKDLALLNAMLLHQQIYGTLPKPGPLLVSPSPVRQESAQALSAPATDRQPSAETLYPSITLQTLLDALGSIAQSSSVAEQE